MNQRLLRVRWLGRLPYEESWDLQRGIHEGKVVGRTLDDYLILVEHPHVFTIGRNGKESNLLVAETELAEMGVRVHRVDRGGDITYHGPGQLVGYPLVTIPDQKRVVPYVRDLEEVLIRTLSDFGVESWREPGLTGVWTEKGKVAAIGVRVSRHVTLHGFSLNLSPDMAFFEKMVPCGIPDRSTTSLQELTDERVSIEEAVEVLIPNFVETFGYADPEIQLGAFTRRQGRESEFEVDRMVAAGAFSPDAQSGEASVFRRLPGEPERPEWMRVTARMDSQYLGVKRLMRDLALHTVCEEARCPNIFECWKSGTATLMILGDTCTRACSFCNVATGKPSEYDLSEPERAADAVASMNLRHAVITSVDRDDLPDGGSAAFAETIRRCREKSPMTAIEVLIPDFKGDREALETVMSARPEVLNHNTETVLRLQREIRTLANYGRSLALLARAKWLSPEGLTKSGIIVGMGETREEVLGALADLRAVGIDIVTIGQYLRPTSRHRPIHRYVDPNEFAEYKVFGEKIGIPHVESGPLVRSSYHAKEGASAAEEALSRSTAVGLEEK